ncbi:MAG TPA: phage major capsid protein, partial [Acidimicrobiales bacterium]|nr:phage major capsid protein [Acidimicrobiales bacterium]
VDSETRGVTTDLRRDVNRQLFGTSDGVIIKVAANSSTTTLNLHASATTTQKNQLEVGMIVDIGTSSPFTSVATEREITAINFDANDVPESIVISGNAVTTSNGDSVVRSGSGGSGSAQVELTGLQSIVANSGTLFSVDPAVEPVWKSTVLSNGGTPRAATETLLAQAVQKGAIRGGVEIDVFVTSDGVHRNYASQLNTYKRINDTLELKGGYKALSLAAGSSEKGVIWDRDCPNNQAFGLAFAHLTQHEASDWEWMDDDGAVLSRVSGKDAYEATLYKYHELTTDKRNAHVLVKDLSES